jgi:hypothetical protein
MKHTIVNHGFVEPLIITVGSKAQYLGGKLPREVILEDGQYDDYLPVDEIQTRNGIDPCNCTSEGWDNQHAIYFKRKFNLIYDFSARDNGIKAGTRPPGNDPHVVYETARNNGVAEEHLLPFSDDIDTIEKYYSYGSKQIQAECIENASEILDGFEFFHEWLWEDKRIAVKDKQRLLMEYLRYSPVAVSVRAWEKKGEYYAKERLAQDTHWCVVYGYKEGKYWKVLDSYPPFKKKLAWDYDFGYAKRVYVTRREQTKEAKINWRQLLLIDRLLELISRLKYGALGALTSPTPIQDAIARFADKVRLIILPPKPKYRWDGPLHVRHSVRLICDEEGLSLEAKNIITACIQQESQFNPKAIGKPNKDGTIDYGLCQYNNGRNKKGVPYWIGPGADFASVEEVLNDPEKNVRVMIREYKAGHIKWWASYSTGAYKKYL